MIKKITGIILGLLLIVFLIPFINSEFFVCMKKGEKINYCSNYKPSFTCNDKIGCEMCMSVYKQNKDCYIHGVWPKCNKIKRECSNLGNTDFDSQPPNLTINSPNKGIYNSKRVLFNLSADELSLFYYKDNLRRNSRWRKFTSKHNLFYKKIISLKEGINEIAIKAVDKNLNKIELVRQLYIDSKKPKIRRNYPRRGFADGKFFIEFSEENPKNLFLNYGNNKTGERNIELNIDDCSYENKKYSCFVEVNLEDYNNENIRYWFEIIDIAGNKYSNKAINLKVDVSKPILNNPDDFWSQGKGRYNKYIYFNINATENNFKSIFYTYKDNRGRIRQKRICSRLKNGKCKRRMSFRKGEHKINIKIIDKAGNFIEKNIEFEVE